MAGKIVADTLEHSTAGSVTTDYVVNGSAKVWASMIGSNTAGINQSLNSSSLTDNGTGDYTLTNTSAFDYSDYATGCGSQWRRSLYTNAQTSSTIRFYTTEPNSSETTLVDSGTNNYSITYAGFGDLA